MTSRLIDSTSGAVLAEHVETAETAWARTKGLLGRNELPKGHALIIAPCASIHMFFMRFPIDAIFVDEGMKVLSIRSHLSPWRMASCFAANAVIELPADSVDIEVVMPGNVLKIEE